MAKIGIALLILLNSALSWSAETTLTPFTAHYTVSRGNLPLGEVQRVFSRSGGDAYVYTSTMQTSGIAALLVQGRIEERSVGSSNNVQIKPQHYTYLKTGGKKRRELNLQFNWTQGVAQNTVPSETWEFAIPADAQDQLSYQLALMRDLQNGKTELSYPIADKEKLRTYRFKIVGEETLDTPLGPLQTVKLERVTESNDRSTRVWCAPSLNYLPVRIEQTEKDDSEYTLLIKSVEGLG